MRDPCDNHDGAFDDPYDTIRELRTENSRLREALAPFIAPESKQLTRPRSDREEVPVVVTWGEYRRARAALRQGGGGSDATR